MKTIESADIPEASRKAFVSYADHLLLKGYDEGIERGIEKGIERGIEKGLNKGRLDAVIKIIQKRFGPLPENIASQLESIDGNSLDLLLDAALDAESLSEWLNAGNINAD